MKKNEIEIQDYQKESNKLFSFLDSRNHQQEGDPNKCAQVLIKVSELNDPPLNLFLGEDAIRSAEEKLKQTQDDINKYRDLMSSTFYTRNKKITQKKSIKV